MKRLLVYLFIIVVIVGAFVSFVFSPKGSSLLQPYVQNRLEKELGVPVEIQKMNFGPQSGKIFLLLNKELHVRIAANYNLFDDSFKGIYKIQAKHFNYKEIKLKKIKLQGKFQGVPSNISINGKGIALNSKAAYSFKIIHDEPQKIEVKMKGMQLAEILQLTGNHALAKGKVDIDIHMPSMGGKDVKGYGHITVHRAYINNRLIKKMYGIELPKKSYILAKIDAKLAGENVVFSADSKSNIFNMQLKNAAFNIEKKEFLSSYDMHIKNIQTLLKGSKIKSQDPIDISGKIKFNETLLLTGEIKGMGEKTSFEYANKKLKLNAKHMVLEQLFTMFAMPNYVKGKINIDLDLNTKDPQLGKFTLKSTEIQTVASEMKKLVGNPLSLKLMLQSKGSVKKDMIVSNTTVKSNIGTLNLDNMQYNRDTLGFKSNYTLGIPDLKKTTVLTGKTFYGKFKTSGTLLQEEILRIAGNSTSLGGDFSYTIVDGKIDSTLTEVPLSGIFKLLGVKSNFTGIASGVIHYDMENKTGKINIDVNSFRIKSSSFTRKAALFLGGKDPSRVIFKKTKFRATIKGNRIAYALHAPGAHASIDLRNGNINTKRNTHTATFKLVYEKRNIVGKIKGSYTNPKFSIVPSAATKKRIEKKVKSKLKKILGEKNSGFLKDLHF